MANTLIKNLALKYAKDKSAGGIVSRFSDPQISGYGWVSESSWHYRILLDLARDGLVNKSTRGVILAGELNYSFDATETGREVARYIVENGLLRK